MIERVILELQVGAKPKEVEKAVEFDPDTAKGSIIREGAAAQLGKRFVCGEEEAVPESTTKRVEYISGEVVSKDGRIVNFGCGTNVLITKASESHPACCGIPMTLITPKLVPSSD